MKQVTQGIARFAARLRFENLDPSLIQKFKKYLLDGMGCGLYGRSLPWCQIVNRFIKEQRGKKESTLWLEARVDFPTGSPEHPMSFGQVMEKFRSLAGKVINKDRMDVLIEKVEGIEKLGDIRDLTRPVASKGGL